MKGETVSSYFEVSEPSTRLDAVFENFQETRFLVKPRMRASDSHSKGETFDLGRDDLKEGS